MTALTLNRQRKSAAQKGLNQPVMVTGNITVAARISEISIKEKLLFFTLSLIKRLSRH